MKDQKPLSERIIWLIKNNRILAYIIVCGSIVIALGIFTDAIRKIIETVRREQPAEARTKLGQMNLPVEPDIFLKCVKKGDLTAVKLFLAAKIDPDVAYWDGTTALMLEAAKGRTPLLDALLKAGADVNKKTHYGQTALSEAAAQGKLDSLSLLLDRGANREARNGALPRAASGGHIEILRILIDRGVDAHSLNEAFVAAAVHARVKLLPMLFEKGADARKIGALALTGAAGRRGVIDISDLERTETIRYLLDLGVDPNTAGEDGWTALCNAIWDRRLSTAKVLLNGGANSNAICKDPGGGTPLTLAAGHRAGSASHEIIQSLLENGADPNLRSPDGSTALIEAVSWGGETAVIRELLKTGADPKEKNANGKTAAEIAEEKWLPDKRDEILQLLREYEGKKKVQEK
jgi:uncharacterized protein